MEDGLWYVRDAGTVTGPLPALEVREGIAARRFPRGVEVSKDRTSWRPASSVRGLCPDAAVLSAAPAPVAAAQPAATPPGTGAARFGPPPAGSRFGPPPDPSRFGQAGRVGQAEPMAGLPEPDAWSSHWGTLLAVVSLAAWILPIAGDVIGLPGRRDGSTRWLFPWSPELTANEPFAWKLVQPLTALAALAIVRFLRGAMRGGILLTVTGIAVLASLVFQEGRGGLDQFVGPAGGGARTGGIIVLALLAGGLGAAVGNHLRKRSPAEGPWGTLCVVGGALVVLAFLIPIHGVPIIRAFFEFRAWSAGWPLVLLLVLTLAYGGLGVRHLSSNPAYEGRCVWMSRLGRVLLVAPPIAMAIFLALVGNETLTSVGPSFLGLSLLLAKGWGSFVGLFALIGVGLAASLEEGIYLRQPKGADPRATAEVFR